MKNISTPAIVLLSTATLLGTTAWTFRQSAPKVQVVERTGQTETRRQFSQSVDISGVHQFTLRLPVGSVHLVKGAANVVSVRAVRSIGAPVTDQARQWLHSSNLTVQRQGSELLIEDHPYGQAKGVPASRMSRLNLDLVITLPADLDADMNIGFGALDGAGSFRSLRGSIGAGTVNLQRLATRDGLTLNVGAGTIETGLSAPLAKTSHFSAGAGTVTLNLPDDASAVISASVGVGSIAGLPAGSPKQGVGKVGDERKGRFGRGVAAVAVHVGTGEIHVHSASTATQMAAVSDRFGENEGMATAFLSAKEMKQMDADIQREIQDAIRSAKDELASAGSQAEMDAEMKDAEREMKEAMAEFDRSMAESEWKDPDIQREVAEAMREAKVQVKKAIRESHAITREALSEALKAIEAMQKALKSGQ